MGKFSVSRTGVPRDILIADDENHMRYRRFFSPAFSSRAVAEQQELVSAYADLLVKQLPIVRIIAVLHATLPGHPTYEAFPIPMAKVQGTESSPTIAGSSPPPK